MRKTAKNRKMLVVAHFFGNFIRNTIKTLFWGYSNFYDRSVQKTAFATANSLLRKHLSYDGRVTAHFVGNLTRNMIEILDLVNSNSYDRSVRKTALRPRIRI